MEQFDGPGVSMVVGWHLIQTSLTYHDENDMKVTW